MANDEFQSVTFKCPKCGHVNTIVANNVPDTLEVDCAQCGAQLGRWGMLKNKFEWPRTAKHN